MDENELEAWGLEERTVTMTNEQWNKLVCYIHLSHGFREDAVKSWESIAKETKPDGSPVFKYAARNAEYWNELIAFLEQIVPKLDGTTA